MQNNVPKIVHAALRKFLKLTVVSNVKPDTNASKKVQKAVIALKDIAERMAFAFHLI